MAPPSASNRSSTSITSTSSQIKGLKKVLSNRRRSSDLPSETGTRWSIDSTSLEKSPTLQSADSSPNREGSRFGSNGVRKLIPGHGKRQRRRQREEEVKAALQSDIGGIPADTAPPPVPVPVTSSIGPSKSNSSLLTDAEVATPPPLISRDSHSGYFTTSSPLIASKAVASGNDPSDNTSTDARMKPTTAYPSIVEPIPSPPDESPKSTPKLTSTPKLPPLAPLERSDSLQVESARDRRNSFSKLRGKSPARKVRDMFTKAGRSPRSSPERGYSPSIQSSDSFSSEHLSSEPEPKKADSRRKAAPAPLSNLPDPAADPLLPSIKTSLSTPSTPPSAITATPLTTVTPPTPTDKKDGLSKAAGDAKGSDSDNPNIVVSHSGNMISHRRVQSASNATHSKSKLSTSMTAPLTPTIEEIRSSDRTGPSRNITPGSGFFSSWVSAAQNAASTITSLTAQNRNRSGTTSSDPVKPKAAEEIPAEAEEIDESSDSPVRKKLAIETLGSGDLNFGHLGIGNVTDERDAAAVRPSLADLRLMSDFTRNEAHAKEEDALAKRAVSAAYEQSSTSTPVAEISDPIASLRHTQTMDPATMTARSTTPNGSIFEDEPGPVRRSNSVRSKLAKRRSRGSSIATGHSTLGAMIGASTALLANPAGTSKATGFTPAPKARNRTFHQLFRSVPEDDNLIEDYSCALQKEILLAGRIYISEGHICFSSNILGWVTTLIISFEEIVSVERENTAMIIPNAIAIQTLHARHMFRSLLSREATLDLMIGIWKVNHPTSFQKSVNGQQILAEQTKNVAANPMGPTEEESEGSSDDSDDASGSDDEDDNDHESAPSILGSGASVAGSEFIDAKSVARKPSGLHNTPVIPSAASGPVGDIAAAAVVAGVADSIVDFPGPITHAPTECTDSTTHYEKVIKDEVIPAPLGKVYSLLYGPQSGAFVRKYLVDECKCTDLVMDDDKKGLNNDSKSRQYSYTKPLNAPIGPKSTKCITTENLDSFDLEKSVSVTCTTQTPNVPSGSAFSTKTRYCLTWAPGNATRLQMNCTIEWTAKSWLKGPIENGANEGQQQYGDGLVKALKAAVGRSRATTVGSKGPRSKKKRKGEKKPRGDKVEAPAAISRNWGPLEPLRAILEPAASIFGPILRMDVAVAILTIMVLTMWFGGSSRHSDIGYPGSSSSPASKLGVYEELWQRQEGELWDWLESRAGVNRMTTLMTRQANSKGHADTRRQQDARERARQLKAKEMATKLRGEKWNRQEIEEAVRMTREKLDSMQQALEYVVQ